MMTHSAKLEDAVTGQVGNCLELPLRGKPDALEAIESAADEMRQISKRWQDRATVERHTVAENYAEGRLSLICDLHILVPDTGVDGAAGRMEGPFRYHEVFCTAVFAVNVPDIHHVFPSDQQPVLILDVENVQSPEGFSSASRVWLYPLHDVIDDCFGGLLFQSSIDGDYKFVPRFVKGKLGEPVSTSQRRELHIANGKVESARKIVNRVPDDQKNVFRNSLISTDLEKAISGLRIIIDQNTVRAAFVEVSGLQVEIIDVLIGPFDL